MWCAASVAVLAGVIGWSCSPKPPVLTAVVPDTGYPRQLLAIDGSTLYAGVVWDAGLPSETVLYNGLFGTTYFQIPANATVGSHPVALRNSLGTSVTSQVTVLQSRGVFPAPRIEDIGIFVMDGNGPVDVALTVAAANLDVDATVTAAAIVAGSPVAKNVAVTIRWGALPVDYLQYHQPDTFGYPIYHYTQLLSIVEGVALGSTLQVTVTNTDGQTATKAYTLPSSVADLDSDGDGLLDAWEEGSYTAQSGNKVPLATMGTDKWRKDILVEVDWMAAAAPQPPVWEKIEQTFRDAPVLNPDGSRGINIIIDHGQGSVLADGGQQLANSECLSYDSPPAGGAPGCASLGGFFNYKAANFNTDRLHIFHYAIFGQKEMAGQSGLGERHGNDFFVTLANLFSLGNDADVQAGHFVHELGHNLGFSHGDLKGDDQNFNFKPNLPSVMNYTYVDGGVDVDCDMIPDGVYTYSQGTLASLDEASLDETVGICDAISVDMNFVNLGGNLVRGDGLFTAGALDIVGNGDTSDKSDDFDQWGNLLFKFDVRGSAWNSN